MSVRCLAVALSCVLGTSPSCGLTEPGSSGTDDLVFETESLTAILKLPQGYDASKPYPLLVALHGNGGTAQGLAPWLSPLEADSFIVATPQGEYPGPAGGSSWFYMTQDRSLWEEYDTRSVDHVVELAAAIGARYPVGKVFVLGFSQGASLAYMTGLRNPSRVWGVLAIGGILPEIDRPGSVVHAHHVADARNLSVFIARGTSDNAVGREAFISQRDFFLANGYSVTTHEYGGGHWLTDELLAQVRKWLRSQQGTAQPTVP